MSLDVYLEGKTEQVPCRCPECFHQHTRYKTEEFYWANITHNLGNMAEEAGIYKVLWRPDENGIVKAGQLVEPLSAGLALLKSDPKRFERFNDPNGWGLYENFVPFVENYLKACERHPDATVVVSR